MCFLEHRAFQTHRLFDPDQAASGPFIQLRNILERRKGLYIIQLKPTHRAPTLLHMDIDPGSKTDPLARKRNVLPAGSKANLITCPNSDAVRMPEIITQRKTDIAVVGKVGRTAGGLEVETELQPIKKRFAMLV